MRRDKCQLVPHAVRLVVEGTRSRDKVWMLDKVETNLKKHCAGNRCIRRGRVEKWDGTRPVARTKRYYEKATWDISRPCSNAGQNARKKRKCMNYWLTYRA